jgi:hypothetical protein
MEFTQSVAGSNFRLTEVPREKHDLSSNTLYVHFSLCRLRGYPGYVTVEFCWLSFWSTRQVAPNYPSATSYTIRLALDISEDLDCLPEISKVK